MPVPFTLSMRASPSGATRQRAEGRGDSGHGRARGVGAVDAVHERSPRGAGEDEDRAARERRDLVAGQAVAGVGPGVAAPEAHRPRGAERKRRDHRAEIGVVRVHPDALPGAVLVHDALHGEGAGEAGPKPFGHRLGPPGKRRGGNRPGRTPIVVPVAVVLHPAADVGHPRRLGDAQEDARLLRGGDEVGDDDRPVGEDAVGVARHALSPGAKRTPAWALGSDSGGRTRSGLQKGGPTPKRRSPRWEGGET